MQETSPIRPAFTADPPRHTVQGAYRVAVEALAPSGEARGQVIETLRAPTTDEWIEVHGPRSAEMPLPDAFTFVGALPGEIVDLDVTWTLPRQGRKRARRVPPPTVRVRAVVEASPLRVSPRCPVFGECGGCQLQHMDYAAQLAWKTDRVRTALAGAGMPDVRVLPAIGCEPPWEYRNHMRFSVNRAGRAGLTARGSHRVLPLAHCPIASPRINIAFAALERHTLPQPQALIRTGEATGEVLLQPPPAPQLRDVLTAEGLDLRDDALEEELLGTRFRIRPSSFFQTNTRQANRMAALVLERLPAGLGTTLVDAYCGVGTFARLMAARASRVLAVEESASSIRDARWNLRDAANVEIVQAKVEDWLPGVAERLDGLVIDPPRVGCQRRVLDALVERRMPRVVYVSCDPDTLARDLAYLCQARDAYRLVEVQPLDMFPQTAHIENIATLEAR